MCIAVWLWNAHPQYRLLLALNRDEYHNRSTESVHWWEQENILGGKDCKSGGTWFASARNGRVCFVTNFREPFCSPTAKSRGELVTRFLLSSKTPLEFSQEVSQEAHMFNGFNLVLMDVCSCEAIYVTNRYKGNKVSLEEVAPGLHVLSNAQLDTPWFKAQRAKEKFTEIIRKFGEGEIPETEIIENVLKDTTKADISMLPQTGCSVDWEYSLSSIFVSDESQEEGPYGTRSMIVLSADQTNHVKLYEQYLEDGKWKEHEVTYNIQCENQ